MRVQVAIIGGGPAGISAAIWCKRLNISHVLLEARKELGGQLHSIYNPIIDYPGLITGNGKDFAAALNSHIKSLDCNAKLGAKVISMNQVSKEVIYMENNRELSLVADSLILATGVNPRRLYIPGEQEMLDRGEVYSATKDAAKFVGKNVAVVGGGDRAFEGTILLAKYCKTVVLINRSDQFRASKDYVEAVINQSNILMLIGYTLEEICGNGQVEKILVRSIQTDKRLELPVEAVMIRVGVEPNIQLIGEKLELNQMGYVATDANGQTSTPGVFAIGDLCTSPMASSLSHAASQGMVTVKSIQKYLQGR